MLFVHETGSAANPTILFLHGSPLSGQMWRPQLEQLTEFHCLAPDLPEHGRSAHIPFVMEDAVTRLANLITHSAANGRAHLVGLSFGGVVAQAMMVQRPDVVDHVILSGTAAPLSKPVMALFKAQLYLNKPIMRLLRPEQLSALMLFQFGIPGQYRSMLGEEIEKVSPDAMNRFLLATYSQIVTPARANRLLLVAVGQKETWFAKRMARQLHHTIAGATGVMVPGAGHVWNLQLPALFSEMVRAWVTDRPLPGELRPL